MTILPKKKATKEKNEAENVDHSLNLHNHSHSHHHTSTSENRLARNSPTRWLPTTSREEKKQNHDPGGGFDPHESASGHNNLNKRRHRSSPHRNHSRKHRGAHSGANVAHPPQQTVSAEYEETENNSGDEYVPPSHPENIEEVIICTCTSNYLDLHMHYRCGNLDQYPKQKTPVWIGILSML